MILASILLLASFVFEHFCLVSLQTKCTLECYDYCMKSGINDADSCQCPIGEYSGSCNSIKDRLERAEVYSPQQETAHYLDAHHISVHLIPIPEAFVYFFEFTKRSQDNWTLAGISSNGSFTFPVPDICHSYDYRSLVLRKYPEQENLPILIVGPQHIGATAPPFLLSSTQITMEDPIGADGAESVNVSIRWPIPTGYRDTDVVGYEAAAVYPLQCHIPEDSLPTPYITILPGGARLTTKLPASILQARCRLWAEVRMLPRCLHHSPFLIQKSIQVDCERSPNIDVCRKDAIPICTDVVDVWGSSEKATIMWQSPDHRSPISYHVRYGPAQMQGVPPFVSWQIVHKNDVKVKGNVKSYVLTLPEDLDYGVQVCAIYSTHRQRAKLGVASVTPFVCTSCKNVPTHSVGRCGECAKIEGEFGGRTKQRSTTASKSDVQYDSEQTLDNFPSQTVLRMEADLVVHERLPEQTTQNDEEHESESSVTQSTDSPTEVATVNSKQIESSTPERVDKPQLTVAAETEKTVGSVVPIEAEGLILNSGEGLRRDSSDSGDQDAKVEHDETTDLPTTSVTETPPSTTVFIISESQTPLNTTTFAPTTILSTKMSEIQTVQPTADSSPSTSDPTETNHENELVPTEKSEATAKDVQATDLTSSITLYPNETTNTTTTTTHENTNITMGGPITHRALGTVILTSRTNSKGWMSPRQGECTLANGIICKFGCTSASSCFCHPATHVLVSSGACLERIQQRESNIETMIMEDDLPTQTDTVVVKAETVVKPPSSKITRPRLIPKTPAAYRSCVDKTHVDATFDQEAGILKVRSEGVADLLKHKDSGEILVEFGQITSRVRTAGSSDSPGGFEFLGERRHRTVLNLRDVRKRHFFSDEPLLVRVNGTVHADRFMYGVRICYLSGKRDEFSTEQDNLPTPENIRNENSVQAVLLSAADVSPLRDYELTAQDTFWNAFFMIGKISLLVVLVLITSVLVYLNCTKIKLLYERRRSHHFQPLFAPQKRIPTVSGMYDVMPNTPWTSLGLKRTPLARLSERSRSINHLVHANERRETIERTEDL